MEGGWDGEAPHQAMLLQTGPWKEGWPPQRGGGESRCPLERDVRKLPGGLAAFAEDLFLETAQPGRELDVGIALRDREYRQQTR